MSGTNSIDLNMVLGASEESLAAEITSLFVEWRGAAKGAYDRWKETTKYVFATSTKDTTNASNGHDHSTHLPIITQIKDSLEANYMEALFPSDDWFVFKGYDLQSSFQDKREVVEAYIKTKHDVSGFTSTIQRLISDWTLYGNCFAGVTYEQQTHDIEENVQSPYGFVGPKVYRISPFDIVFNPLATSFENSPKIIRSLKSLAELSRDAEENPSLGYSQDIIDRVISARERLSVHKEVDVDKAFNLSFEGFGSPSSYYKSGKVEILEFYGDIWDVESRTFLKNYVITVVDRRWVLRAEPLNTWTGRPHIYHCGWRERPDNLWAMGPLDNLVGMQYMINHLENARADAFDMMLQPDRVFQGAVEDIQQINGSLHYFVGEQGGVHNLSPDTTVLNADFQIQNKQAQMEMAAGAPREAAGFRTPGEKTAFEVSQLMNSASRMFQHKINLFSREFLEKLLEAEIEVARQNLDTIDVIEIIEDEYGVSEFITITKEDIKANGRLKAIGARHYARNNQLAGNLAQFSQQLMQDPLMQQHFPSERLARAWENLLGFNNLDLMQPYGRVAENLELQRMTQVAQQWAAEEMMTPTDEEEEMVVDEEEL